MKTIYKIFGNNTSTEPPCGKQKVETFLRIFLGGERGPPKIRSLGS